MFSNLSLTSPWPSALQLNTYWALFNTLLSAALHISLLLKMHRGV